MEKMMYERPVMRVQEFRAGEFCDPVVYTCTRKPYVQSSTTLDYFVVMLNGAKFLFDTTRHYMLNPVSKTPEYYYEEYNGPNIAAGDMDHQNDKEFYWYGSMSTDTHYLAYNSKESTSDNLVFNVYEDKEKGALISGSGYNTSNGWVDGTGSLQTDGTSILGSFIQFGNENLWKPDYNMGSVSFDDTATQITYGYTHS